MNDFTLFIQKLSKKPKKFWTLFGQILSKKPKKFWTLFGQILSKKSSVKTYFSELDG